MAVTTCDRQVRLSLRALLVLTAEETGRKARPGERCWALVQSGQSQDRGRGQTPHSNPPSVAQVRSRRCDVKTKFVTHLPCTVCPAIKRRMCPTGWLRELPEKILRDCKCGSLPASLPASRSVLGGVGGRAGGVCKGEPGRPGR